MDFISTMTFDLNYDKGMKDFNRELDIRRAKLYKAQFPISKNPEERDQIVSIDDIEEDLGSGEYRFSEKGIIFQCLIQRKDSDALYVFLNGAAGTAKKPGKSYHRWSWGNLINASIVNILDPMYDEYSELPIGWYWGTEDLNYRELMGSLIRKIADKLGCSYDKIVLYGSSAGGTGALYTAHYIKGCTAVAINPQIRPWKHEWGERFHEITGIDLKVKDRFHREDFVWHVKNSPESKFLVIANCRSRMDFNWQIVPMAEKFSFMTHYGLMQKENLFTWIYDTGSMSLHRAMEYPEMFLMIHHIVSEIRGGECETALNKKVILLNELWREHWETHFHYNGNHIG